MNSLNIRDVIEISAVKPNLVVKVGEINSEQKDGIFVSISFSIGWEISKPNRYKSIFQKWTEQFQKWLGLRNLALQLQCIPSYRDCFRYQRRANYH